MTLDSIGDAVIVTDLAGSVTYLNLEAESLTGWLRDEALGQPLTRVFQIIDAVSRITAPNPAQRAIAEDHTVGLAIGCVLIGRDGTELGIEDSAAPIHDRDGALTGAVIVFHDVGRSRLDQVLKNIAQRVKACVRESDTVCRCGGDEFIIVLTEIASPEDAAKFSEKVLTAVGTPLVVDGHAVEVGASIGISLYPGDATEIDALMRRADLAMYQAKAVGRDGYVFAGKWRPARLARARRMCDIARTNRVRSNNL